MRKTELKILAGAMAILGADIASVDGAASAAIFEASDRLREQEALIMQLQARDAVHDSIVFCARRLLCEWDYHAEVAADKAIVEADWLLKLDQALKALESGAPN
jgi:hypothetical protein